MLEVRALPPACLPSRRVCVVHPPCITPTAAIPSLAALSYVLCPPSFGPSGSSGRCGLPKKGHVCAYQPRLRRRDGEATTEALNAAVQVEMDPHLTIRELKLSIQGTPESYTKMPHGEHRLSCAGETRSVRLHLLSVFCSNIFSCRSCDNLPDLMLAPCPSLCFPWSSARRLPTGSTASLSPLPPLAHSARHEQYARRHGAGPPYDGCPVHDG